METTVTDVADRNRFEISVDGEVAGFVTYSALVGEIALNHTEIDSRFEGQGLGSTLAKEVLNTARERGLAVLPYCPFIRSYIQRHPEFAHLVPASNRERFGIDADTAN